MKFGNENQSHKGTKRPTPCCSPCPLCLRVKKYNLTQSRKAAKAERIPVLLVPKFHLGTPSLLKFHFLLPPSDCLLCPLTGVRSRTSRTSAFPNERGCLKTQSHRRSLHVVQRDRKLALPGGHYGVGNSCRPFAAVLVAAGY